MLTFFIIVFVIILLVVFSVVYVEGEQEKMDNIEKNLPDFSVSNKVRDNVHMWEFAVDAERRKFCYFTRKTSPEMYSFDDVISFELVANGTSVATRSVANTIGSAILGGLLGGNVGAIIGGTSAKVSTANGFTMLLVKVRLRNIEKPSLTVDILGGVSAAPKEADEKLLMAHQVIDLLTYIVDDVNSCT